MRLLKTVLLVLLFFSCSVNEQQDVDLQKDINSENLAKKRPISNTFCDRVSFDNPVPSGFENHPETIASSSTLTGTAPNDCFDPKNVTPDSSSSSLEDYFYCKYGLDPIELGSVCDTDYTYIPLFKVCYLSTGEPPLLVFYGYPDYNNMNGNTFSYYYSYEEQDYFDTIVDLAKSVMGNYDSIAALDFYYMPQECEPLCLCITQEEADGSTTLVCGHQTLYIRFKLCKKQSPNLGL